MLFVASPLFVRPPAAHLGRVFSHMGLLSLNHPDTEYSRLKNFQFDVQQVKLSMGLAQWEEDGTVLDMARGGIGMQEPHARRKV